MSKTFRPWKIDETLFLPPMVQDFVAEDHLARFVLNLVRDEIDLAAITGSYGGERGQPPFDPMMMTTLLLYSCLTPLPPPAARTTRRNMASSETVSLRGVA
jgi:hypothetical protein